jgi:DNA repair protein RecO (recombination protein O)
MGPPQVSEALVLRTRSFGESDKIVTFLTSDAGKLTGIAKGAKNSRRRFANCLDPFTQVRVHYRVRQGASLVFMDSCELLQAPGALSDPKKFAYASYLVELVDQLTGDGHPVTEIFRLLGEGLDVLRCGAATSAVLRVFELQLLRHAGYDPQLQHCGRCHRRLEPAERAFFDPVHAGVVCAACSNRSGSVIPVAGETLAALVSIKGDALRETHLRRLTIATAAEAAKLMGHLLAQHLPRPLRSVKLIAALSG